MVCCAASLKASPAYFAAILSPPAATTLLKNQRKGEMMEKRLVLAVALSILVML